MEGHIRRECKKLAKDRKQLDRKSRNSQQKVKVVKNNSSEVCFAAGNRSAERNLWFLDSGATPHMTNHESMYFFKPNPEQSMLTTVSHPKEYIHVWLRRFGHRSADAIANIVCDQLGTGISPQQTQTVAQ